MGCQVIAGREQKDGDATTPVVQWQVGDWGPSEDVITLFESLGRQEWLELEWSKYRNTPDRDLLGNSTSSRI